MRVAVFGTGAVGQTLAARLAELGHTVTVGTRDVGHTRAQEAFGSWAADHPQIALAAFADAASAADLVINATNGLGSVPAVTAAGPALDGKVVIDVSNALDFSNGFPPQLFVRVDQDSLGQQIQRAVPLARVVKALCTVNCEVMARPSIAGDDHTMFVAGDDASAKAQVTELLRSMGWVDVLDLGGLESAQGMEAMVLAWLRVRLALGHNEFGFKVVTPSRDA